MTQDLPGFGHLDHIVIAAETLDEGIAYVEDVLGITLAPGGQHPVMGTHNRLLGLAKGLYLEVIATDPEAAAPDHARWFDLDNFTGPPRLVSWIVRNDKLAYALDHAPDRAGIPVALDRGDLHWKMAVPQDGKLPFDGMFPALVEWAGEAHPSKVLPESGCALTALTIYHPEAEALRATLAPLLADARVIVAEGEEPGLEAIIETADGPRTLV